MVKKELTQLIKKTAKKQKSIIFCYLFGSHATQTNIAKSDIDIAVFLDPKKEQNFFDIRLELIKVFTQSLKKEADILVLNTAPPFIKYVAIKEGELVLSKDESKRIDFELKSFNEYFDYRHIMKMYDQALLYDD